MVSICIPVYNYDVKKLVTDLHNQANENHVLAEIILIDDASAASFKQINKNINLPTVRFISLEKNIGRAAIRNLFFKEARFENLLFLDCDSGIIHSSFLKNYLEAFNDQDKVICGGRIYSPQRPERNFLLHWKYGKQKESKPTDIRKQNPYDFFMTNNFWITKNILQQVQFDENLSAYGHEDTLFGYDLKKKTIPVQHIDNPVLHEQLETNLAFLEKTKQAVSNLVKILDWRKGDQEFIQQIKLLRTYQRIKKYRLEGLIYFLSSPIIKLSNSLLKKGFISLRLFSLMKLSLFVNLYRKQTKPVR